MSFIPSPVAPGRKKAEIQAETESFLNHPVSGSPPADQSLQRS